VERLRVTWMQSFWGKADIRGKEQKVEGSHYNMGTGSSKGHLLRGASGIKDF